MPTFFEVNARGLKKNTHEESQGFGSQIIGVFTFQTSSHACKLE